MVFAFATLHSDHGHEARPEVHPKQPGVPVVCRLNRREAAACHHPSQAGPSSRGRSHEFHRNAEVTSTLWLLKESRKAPGRTREWTAVAIAVALGKAGPTHMPLGNVASARIQFGPQRCNRLQQVAATRSAEFLSRAARCQRPVTWKKYMGHGHMGVYSNREISEIPN